MDTNIGRRRHHRPATHSLQERGSCHYTHDHRESACQHMLSVHLGTATWSIYCIQLPWSVALALVSYPDPLEECAWGSGNDTISMEGGCVTETQRILSSCYNVYTGYHFSRDSVLYIRSIPKANAGKRCL